jgi:hypothetical protein
MLNNKFSQIDISTDEGMLLLASVAILTGQIDRTKYGSNKTPDEVFEHIQNLANVIFYEEEFKQISREKIIEKILNG